MVHTRREREIKNVLPLACCIQWLVIAATWSLATHLHRISSTPPQQSVYLILSERVFARPGIAEAMQWPVIRTSEALFDARESWWFGQSEPTKFMVERMGKSGTLCISTISGWLRATRSSVAPELGGGSIRRLKIINVALKKGRPYRDWYP
ncbi:hypothetical protein BKA56DRAFT_325689 [Ilyonectria sp. MPI-CAGE-AT-0026]|nr:hypothetical protein BKA56DRAFT_325689 [Ilyonectria sp. MPI-CAGE-AT-0026]